MDGRASAACVAKYLKDYNRSKFIECNYTERLDFSVVDLETTVCFVDYSFSSNTVETLFKLLETGCNVIWIDHHFSSLNVFKDFRERFNSFSNLKTCISNESSGALLTWEFLLRSEFSVLDPPLGIQLVDDYDRCAYKFGSDTTHFKLGVDSEYNDFDSFIWKQVLNFDKTIEFDMIKKGTIIKKYVDTTNKFYLDEYGFETTLNGYKCLAVNKKTNSWISMDKIKEYQICCVFAYNGSKWSYSIFSSDPEVDCSKIAESFGGGGHKGVAGFSTGTTCIF